MLFSASAIICSSNPLSENSVCNRTAGAYPLLDLEAKRKRKNFNRERVLAAQDELQMRIARIWGCKTIVGLVDYENPYMEL